MLAGEPLEKPHVIRRIQQGRKILRDWLGDGGQPVPLDQAQARANTCLGCPHNYKGSWVWNMATSLAIASQMRMRQIMAISLFGEANLAVCDICGCQLKLKVHVPFHHIYRHTPDEMFAKYPAHCWQKHEFNQLKRP